VKHARTAEAEVEGRPELALCDEDREKLEDAIAELLVDLVERERDEEPSA
jgi:hypothetical protein